MDDLKKQFKIIIKAAFCVAMLISVNMLADSSIDEVYETSSETVQQSQTLSDDKEGSWLPVPIPVSNPTIGTGLQVAMIYLHAKKSDADGVPNATSGIAGMWTDSDSKFLGVFHENNFYDDHFRLRTFAGIADFNLHYFGIGNSREDFSLKYNIKSETVLAEFLFLLPNTSNWFIGPRMLWNDADVKFSFSSEDIELPDIEKNSITSSLGLVVKFDERDDNYYPTEGQNLELVLLKDDENWGSDYSYEKTTFDYMYYWSINKQQVLAFRAALKNVEGRAPFYMLSNLDLRGNAFGRYIDNSSASIHAEWRYKFHQRWGMIGFVETGAVAESFSQLDNQKRITSYGIGLRWQPIATESLHIGLDVALSSDDSAIYIRVGESF